MDFWTAFADWGILLLVGINAFIVIRRGIEVEDREGDAPDH
jgi:hypothetical protein